MANVGVVFALHAHSMHALGGGGSMLPPGNIWIFRLSESVSGAFWGVTVRHMKSRW